MEKSLSNLFYKEYEAFMPIFLHSYKDHRKSFTVMEDIFHETNFKKKIGELASEVKFFFDKILLAEQRM